MFSKVKFYGVALNTRCFGGGLWMALNALDGRPAQGFKSTLLPKTRLASIN
jgi:hypothetical protein